MPWATASGGVGQGVGPGARMAADRVARRRTELARYWLSTLTDGTPVERPVHLAMMHWRIECGYQDLKQKFDLGHVEGRRWRGFNHHASLCIAGYRFLVAQRLVQGGSKRTPQSEAHLPCPRTTCHAALQRAPHRVTDPITTLRWRIAACIARRPRRCPICTAVRGTITTRY